MHSEDIAIKQLTDYKRIAARIKVLENYSIGSGITVSRLNQDDQLQELHRRLRGMPSYMYLGKHEQQLEATAHAYLTKYPAGIKSQLAAVPRTGADEEDSELLRELRGKIQKVIAARGWEMDDIDAVLERVAELQDLQAEVEQIDNVLEALEGYKPEYARLLRLRFIDGLNPVDTAKEFNVVRQTFHRWQHKALTEYVKLAQ